MSLDQGTVFFLEKKMVRKCHVATHSTLKFPEKIYHHDSLFYIFSLYGLFCNANVHYVAIFHIFMLDENILPFKYICLYYFISIPFKTNTFSVIYFLCTPLSKKKPMKIINHKMVLTQQK